jgi:hypothetical protein
MVCHIGSCFSYIWQRWLAVVSMEVRVFLLGGGGQGNREAPTASVVTLHAQPEGVVGDIMLTMTRGVVWP